MRVRCGLSRSGASRPAQADVPPVVRGFTWFSLRLAGQPHLTFSLGFLLVAAVAVLDAVTGPDLNLSILYLVPITLVAAVAPTAVTFPVVAAALVVWLVSELPAPDEVASAWVYGWNSVARLGSFLLVALLFHALRSHVAYAESLARTDVLTGLSNRRAFEERVSVELARVARYGHPLSLVYLDIDDFKRVNDSGGHAAGDVLLRRVGEELRKGTRRTDTVARIGGDEFAVLLPETSAEAAGAGTAHILERLQAVATGATAGVVTSETRTHRRHRSVCRGRPAALPGETSREGNVQTCGRTGRSDARPRARCGARHRSGRQTRPAGRPTVIGGARRLGLLNIPEGVGVKQPVFL